jgi:hypothetical protein
VIERLIIEEKIGHRRVAEMSREHVRRILAKRSETPGAANSVLQKLKVPIHFAIDVFASPTLGKPALAGLAERRLHGGQDRQGRLPKRCVRHELKLRKAAARRVAEAGCTANEIAAITGHATLQEVLRYTKAAEQKKLAQSVMRSLSPPKPKTDSQTGPKGLGFMPQNPNEISGGSEAWWSRGESNP